MLISREPAALNPRLLYCNLLLIIEKNGKIIFFQQKPFTLRIHYLSGYSRNPVE
jgi:hypothetical protein